MGKKKHQTPAGEGIEGTVTRATGAASLWVQDAAGRQFMCALRGKFRLKRSFETNLVAAGDRVRFLPPEGEELGLVLEVLPRRNFLLRKGAAHDRSQHIMCANVDQVLIVATLKQPRTSTGFVNRFLTIAASSQIPAVLLLNKVDLLESAEELAQRDEFIRLYRKIGYRVEALSAHEPGAREMLQALLKDKMTYLGGHSGAGKSTLINLADPALNLKTAEISNYTEKGKHTTTSATVHALAFGGAVIDSPGIKELGLLDIEPAGLAHLLPEMEAMIGQCRFYNCLHLNEPGCAVKAAVAEGEIDATRYQSYAGLLAELRNET